MLWLNWLRVVIEEIKVTNEADQRSLYFYNTSWWLQYVLGLDKFCAEICLVSFTVSNLIGGAAYAGRHCATLCAVVAPISWTFNLQLPGWSTVARHLVPSSSQNVSQ